MNTDPPGPPPEADPPSAARDECPNCGAVLAGRFCQECGQDRDVDPRSLRHWVADALDDFLGVNGRLPRTLRALFVPGLLTRDWLDGRRTRYAHPLRLFLVCGLALFALPRLFPTELYGGIDLADLTPGRAASAIWSDAFDPGLADAGPTVMIVVMPLFAVLLRLLYVRSGRLYTEHLVFALNMHSVAFLLLLPVLFVAGWESRLPDWAEVPLVMVPIAVIVVQLIGGLMRVYGSSLVGALLRTPVLIGGQFLIVLIGLLIGGTVVEDDPRAAATAADRAYAELASARAEDDSVRVTEMLPRALALHLRIELSTVDGHRLLHLSDLLLEAAVADTTVAPAMRESAYRAARECLLYEPERPLCLGMAARAADELGLTPEAAALWTRFGEADSGDADSWGHAGLLTALRKERASRGAASTRG